MVVDVLVDIWCVIVEYDPPGYREPRFTLLDPMVQFTDGTEDTVADIVTVSFDTK